MTVKEAFDSIVEDGIAKGAGDYVDPEALNVAAVVLAKKIRGLLVEVVRCKDCEYSERVGRSGSYRICHYWSPFKEALVPKDGFCYRGERKDNGTV